MTPSNNSKIESWMLKSVGSGNGSGNGDGYGSGSGDGYGYGSPQSGTVLEMKGIDDD